MKLEEKTLSSQTLFEGKIVKLRVDQIELPNGEPAVREVVEHPGGVCVLALEEGNMVPLVRQFRYPLGRTVLELPAGKLERGEDPLPAAVRELGEEVGLEPGTMTELGCVYLSPGFCDEKLRLYLAQDVKAVPVHPDEDEFLNIERMPFDDLVQMAVSGQIEDAKTMAAILAVKVRLGL